MTSSKANPRLPQDIAYIYEMLHCSHFIILSNLGQPLVVNQSNPGLKTSAYIFVLTVCLSVIL